MPDIYFKTGEVGENALTYVTAAAKYLSELPFVDNSRMGIQGCSFGGYLTNYLTTHTEMFSAACSASGISNFISGYGSLAEDGSSLQAMYEQTYFRMKATPWERPDWYIKNSPIFYLHKVSTPLLIMHTNPDGVCPFEQAIELFTGLRRLGKKAWMLEYTNGGNHGLFGKAEVDFSIRMQQFFDHYLKQKATPDWMIKIIPAGTKRIGMSLELDTKNATLPEGGVLTPEEKEKADALQNRLPITIKIN
jgi:dipeptidyl aminopeptidase/acylaminoacyl peptidase